MTSETAADDVEAALAALADAIRAPVLLSERQGRQLRLVAVAGFDTGAAAQAMAEDPALVLALLARLPDSDGSAMPGELADIERVDLAVFLPISRARGYVVAQSQTVPGQLLVAVALPFKAGRIDSALAAVLPDTPTGWSRAHEVAYDVIGTARNLAGVTGRVALSLGGMRRPDGDPDPRVRCVLQANALVGEGPLWNNRDGWLEWVDIAAPAVHAFDPCTGHNATRDPGRLVSAILPTSNGERVLLTDAGPVRYQPATGRLGRPVRPTGHSARSRFNDAKADRAGRLWAGTMAQDAATPTGALYVFAAGACRRADHGFYVANGMDWSPDGWTFYLSDSGVGTIYVYDVDQATGEIGNRRIFVQVPEEAGRPDGLCIDAEGCLWVAHWDGWRVVRYAPDGVVDQVVWMPVPRPTSCCFGGPGLRTLYITSARIRLSPKVLQDSPLSGGLFALDLDVAGQLPASVDIAALR